MNTKSKTQHPDTHFKVMDLIHKHPDISQRELAKQAGISLGSIHYCLKALAHKGWLKAGKFKNNPDKSVYLYLLTPEGVTQKSKLARVDLPAPESPVIQRHKGCWCLILARSASVSLKLCHWMLVLIKGRALPFQCL
jgi:EPS-associated MarR family transcriptional regulator